MAGGRGIVCVCRRLYGRDQAHRRFFPKADTYGQSLRVYVLQVTALAVAIAWLYGHAHGSLLLAMLMHAAGNNTKDVVPSPRP